MRKDIEVVIPGRPVPWARARSRKGGGFFTPMLQREHRIMVAFILRKAMQEQRDGKPFDGPVEMECFFDYGRQRTVLRLRELDGDKWKTTRADLDNTVKEIAEGCQDSGIIADDAQICKIVAEKVK